MGAVLTSSQPVLLPVSISTSPEVLGRWCGPEGSFISKIIPDEWVGICNVGTKNAKFYEGCKVHDECYSTLGVVRAECDHALWSHLGEECDRVFHTWVCQATRGECHLAARGYYESVVKWGAQPFQKSQDKARETPAPVESAKNPE